MRLLKQWFRPRQAPPLPRPETPVCLIGDIHGRADLLDAMLAKVDAQPDSPKSRIIILGDMIDRGPDSLTVLRRLFDLQTAPPIRSPA